MKLADLMVNQKIVVQILWGERKIEFDTEVKGKEEKGVLVGTYQYQGGPLELNIDSSSNIICTIYADDPRTGQRVSWKNVALKTIDSSKGRVYEISTYGYNNMAKTDERRRSNRMIIKKSGKVYDADKDEYTDIIVHDICDIGLSFLAPESFNPSAYQLTVTFEDIVDSKTFNVKADCTVTRVDKKNNLVLYGCKLVGQNKEYLLYSCVFRKTKK